MSYGNVVLRLYKRVLSSTLSWIMEFPKTESFCPVVHVELWVKIANETSNYHYTPSVLFSTNNGLESAQ